jgi:UDP-N-acetylglucosamine--N-acetylmuramyl-(pentapeptide) pyrophosphoryl-undecaprenol N-acetylglucosamine transferase
MKILFTGGGTGGHFYPIIAVAEEVREVAKDKKILQPELYYMAPTKYNPRALFDNDIEFVSVPAGKMRRYFSLLNFFDLFKTATGIASATLSMFRIYPDVVFGKGGYASFPALVAARLLAIPVVIHESDSKPGRVNMWAGKFARRIAVAYPEAGEMYEKRLGAKATDKKGKSKIAYTGNPVRKEIAYARSAGARDYWKLGEEQIGTVADQAGQTGASQTAANMPVPIIMIIGGSQGAKIINDVMIDAIPELIKKYAVIHQTGRANFTDVSTIMTSLLKGNENVARYKPVEYFDDLAMRMAAGAADVIISRAGAGGISEIAAWGKPSIIIPINSAISHDQTENAFAYARSGACTVIEEHNLTPHIIVSEIDRIIGDSVLREKMQKGAQSWARPDAAKEIAQVLLEIALEHE